MKSICYDCNSATGEQKRHIHIWMHSSFCDTCDCDFDTWLQKEKEEVARRLVLDDLNHLVCVMADDEGKFDMQTALEILTRMKGLARARGYLRFPWEKQEDNLK